MTIDTPQKTQEEVIDFLSSPIEDLYKYIDNYEIYGNRLTRLKSMLGCNNIDYIAEVLIFNKEELKRFPNLGNKSIELLEYASRPFDLDLGGLKGIIELNDSKSSTQNIKDKTSFRNDIIKIVQELNKWPSGSPAIQSPVITLKDNENSPNPFTVTIGVRDITNRGVQPEFLEAVLKDPNVQEAVLSLITGFALAAQTSGQEANAEKKLEHNEGPA